MIVGRHPDVRGQAVIAQRAKVPVRTMAYGALNRWFGEPLGPRTTGSDLTNEPRRRLVKIGRDLYRQAAAGREPGDECWQQGSMIGHPLQHGIGQNYVDRIPCSAPRRDI